MPCECDYPVDVGKEERDRLTQNLCYLCAKLKDAGELSKYGNGRIEAWYKGHEAQDEKRVREKMRADYKKYPSRAGCPQGLANEYIAAAQAVHPVSSYHIAWFVRLATEEAQKSMMKQTKKKERTELANKARAKLTDEEAQALGVKE